MAVLTLASQSPTSGRRPAVECRVAERHLTALQTLCQPVAARHDNDLTWEGTIRDISLGGLALALRRRFEPGAGLSIELPGVDANEPETLLARVLHVRHGADGEWIHGCRFISSLSEEEVERFLRLTVLPPTAPANVVTGVTFRGRDAAGRAIILTVQRLSPSGAWPPPPEATVSIKVRGTGGGPATVQVVVDDCRQEADGWLVCGRFVGTPDLQAVRDRAG